MSYTFDENNSSKRVDDEEADEIIQINNDEADVLIDEDIGDEIPSQSEIQRESGKVNGSQPSASNTNTQQNKHMKQRGVRGGRRVKADRLRQRLRLKDRNRLREMQRPNQNPIMPFQHPFSGNHLQNNVNSFQTGIWENPMANNHIPINNLPNPLTSNPRGNFINDYPRMDNLMKPEPNSLFKSNENFHVDAGLHKNPEPLMIVIVDRGFPLIHLGFAHLNRFREAVQREIDDNPSETPPRFEDSAVRKGAIVLLAVDEYAREWLIARIYKLCPWDGAQLRIGGLELFKPLIATRMWIPGFDEDPLFVLQRLKRYNPNLHTEGWLINNIKPQQTDEDEGRMFFISIPETDIDAINKLDYRPYYDLGRLTLIRDG